MTFSAALLVLTLVLPLVMLVACIGRWPREHMLSWLWLAPVPGLAAAFFSAGAPSLVLELPVLKVVLALDLPGAILLGAAALLWICAGAYAATYLRGKPHGGRFAEFWLMTLTGSLGVFMAADLASFFLLFTIASLAAYGLVLHDGTPRALRAGTIYLELAIAGEVFLLMGFVLLATAAPEGDLLISHVLAALPTSPWRTATLLFLLAGFGLKAGLVPLHVWLPIAHPAAPMPASAVLSGAIIKAGIIGLIRFMPLGAVPSGWGMVLVTVGLVTTFYAVAIGITQVNPKTVLAYSSVSQMGLVTTVLGMGLIAGSARLDLDAAYLAAHHVLAKGALFLAVGVAAATTGVSGPFSCRRRCWRSAWADCRSRAALWRSWQRRRSSATASSARWAICRRQARRCSCCASWSVSSPRGPTRRTPWLRPASPCRGWLWRLPPSWCPGPFIRWRQAAASPTR